MADRTANALLRPLGFGEVFDRAVTLYVRNFVPFSLILLFLMVPNGIAQYAFQAQQMGEMAAALKGATTADPFAAYRSPAFAVVAVAFALFLLALPFAFNAIAVGVARLYSGASVDVRACYAKAFAKFWSTIGMVLMDLLILVGAAFLIGVVGGIGFAIAVAIGTLGTIFAVVAFVLMAIVMLAITAFLGVLAIGLYFAMFALVIEDIPVFDALGEGFRRVFRRGELGRALLIVLATFAVTVLQTIVTYATLGLAYFIHQPWLLTLESVLIGTAIYAFYVILLVVYYYDVRVRHEGLDLEAQLASLAAQTA